MFDKFQAEYTKEDRILQLFFLNARILESETTEEVRMGEGAHIECFNFYSFALRLVDTDCQDEAVRLLQADSTIVKIAGDCDKESAEEYP